MATAARECRPRAGPATVHRRDEGTSGAPLSRRHCDNQRTKDHMIVRAQCISCHEGVPDLLMDCCPRTDLSCG